MEGTQKQVDWAENIKRDLMPGINSVAESSRKRAAGRPDHLAMIDKIMAIIETKPASWWIDLGGKFKADAFMDCWKSAAAEAIRSK